MGILIWVRLYSMASASDGPLILARIAMGYLAISENSDGITTGYRVRPTIRCQLMVLTKILILWPLSS
jgi:hypothetical protein